MMNTSTSTQRHLENKKAIPPKAQQVYNLLARWKLTRILSTISFTCVLRDVIAQECIPRIISKQTDCACFWSYIRPILIFFPLFSVLSRVKVDFYCRVIFTCLNNRGNVWTDTRKRESWASVNSVTFARGLSYIASISFTHVKISRAFARKNYATVEINPKARQQ